MKIKQHLQDMGAMARCIVPEGEVNRYMEAVEVATGPHEDDERALGRCAP